MWPANAANEIYKWIDENGTVHYSETAPNDNLKSIEKSALPSLNISEPVDIEKYQAVNSHLAEGNFPSKTSSFIGRLHFAGKPVPISNPHDVGTWLRDENTGKAMPYKSKFDHFTSIIYLSSLPVGTYGLSINVNTNKSNANLYPGDLRKWITFEVRNKSSTKMNIDMEEIIHMTLPEDNNSRLESFSNYCDKPTTYSSPVTFKWEPISQNSLYTYSIQKYTCHPFNFEGIETTDTIGNTSVTLELPKAANNSFYMLSLKASENNRRVGSLMVHGKNGFGWDYRFSVR